MPEVATLFPAVAETMQPVAAAASLDPPPALATSLPATWTSEVTHTKRMPARLVLKNCATKKQ